MWNVLKLKELASVVDFTRDIKSGSPKTVHVSDVKNTYSILDCSLQSLNEPFC